MSNPMSNAFDALKSTLESITVANGYSVEVDTVEYAASVHDSVPGEKMPYIGIVPIGDDWTDMPTEERIAVRVALVCHQLIGSIDGEQAMLKSTDLKFDIHDALYNDRNLGEDDMFVMMRSSQDTVSDVEAQEEKTVTTVMQIEMRLYVPPKSQR
jgi:hypothetical protein